MLDWLNLVLTWKWIIYNESLYCLNARKPCSDNKLKEMTGSGIFEAESGEYEDEEAEGANQTPNNKTGVRMYQVYNKPFP